MVMSLQEKESFMKEKSARERSEALFKKGSLKPHTVGNLGMDPVSTVSEQ